jgi:hypothetical protein
MEFDDHVIYKFNTLSSRLLSTLTRSFLPRQLAYTNRFSSIPRHLEYSSPIFRLTSSARWVLGPPGQLRFVTIWSLIRDRSFAQERSQQDPILSVRQCALALKRLARPTLLRTKHVVSSLIEFSGSMNPLSHAKERWLLPHVKKLLHRPSEDTASDRDLSNCWREITFLA